MFGHVFESVRMCVEWGCIHAFIRLCMRAGRMHACVCAYTLHTHTHTPVACLNVKAVACLQSTQA